MNILLRTLLAVKPQPPVLDAEQIEKASLLRSIFWDGENGGGFADWKSEAELHLFIGDRRESH